MKTYRVTKPFTLSDAAGTRELAPGAVVTARELVPYEADVAHCLTEIAAPAPLEAAGEDVADRERTLR